MTRTSSKLLAVFVSGLAALDGQEHSHATEAHAHPAHGGFLHSLASGTSVNPASWPMPMVMTRAGEWNLMWMGQAFLVSTQQSGPRGADKLYSTNWGMFGAERDLGRGSVMLRAMVSLEPITVTGKSYPLLFQTGETAYGKPLVDRQHPHDLLMELGVHYARPVSEKAGIHFYYAPVGEVALGPVAFPHRASAMELPQATLGHHWQDSTHIASNVLTGGFRYGSIRIEASGFRGQEPDENRWNIDMGAMDSWAARLTWQPTANWVAQVSTGRLSHPEALHIDDIVRSTASAHYTRLRGGSAWSSSVVWARNHKTLGRYATHSLLGETVFPVRRRNFVTGRFEWSQRDELFENESIFPVAAYTIGYTRDLGIFHKVQTGLGFNLTTYTLAAELKSSYGERPFGASIFLRLRLNPRSYK